MSSRTKTKSSGKKEAEKKDSPEKRETRPSGHAPHSVVVSRHGPGTVTRRGKGFSMRELSGAGLAVRLAKAWGVSIDIRRRSMLEPNVQSLKDWNPSPGKEEAPAKGARAPKKPAKKRATKKKRASP